MSLLSFCPKNVRKVFRPLNPPVWLMVAISRVANATASAWVRMAKYAPVTPRLRMA